MSHFLDQLQQFVVATLVGTVGVLVAPDLQLRTEVETCFPLQEFNLPELQRGTCLAIETELYICIESEGNLVERSDLAFQTCLQHGAYAECGAYQTVNQYVASEGYTCFCLCREGTSGLDEAEFVLFGLISADGLPSVLVLHTY